MDLEAAVADWVKRGDPSQAAARIVADLGPSVLGYLTAVLRDESDAREVFGEVAEHVLRGVGGFRGDSAVKTWVYRIAWRAAIRFRTSPERRRGRPLDSAIASEIAEPLRTATATYLRTDAKDWLARVRSELSMEDQSLLILRVDRGLSWGEVASVMTTEHEPVRASRLRKRFERIKERLREAAKSDGLVDR